MLIFYNECYLITLYFFSFVTGKRFAQMEIKATLTDIILKYNFSPCSKTQIPIKYKEGTIMLSPSVGPWLNFTKRKV